MNIDSFGVVVSGGGRGGVLFRWGGGGEGGRGCFVYPCISRTGFVPHPDDTSITVQA